LPRRPARVLGQPRGCQRLPVKRSVRRTPPGCTGRSRRWSKLTPSLSTSISPSRLTRAGDPRS
jgi:hypothetical protein